MKKGEGRVKLKLTAALKLEQINQIQILIYVLDFDSLQKFSSYTCSNSTSGYDSRSSFNDSAGIPEILNYRDQTEKPAAIKQTPTEGYTTVK